MTDAELTAQKPRCIGTNTTPRDLVRDRWPGLSDEDCDYLLWERTCFPVGSISQWLPQLDAVIAELREVSK